MAGKKRTGNAASKSATSGVGRELKAFYHGQPDDAVSTARFYWSKGVEPRQSVVPYFVAKRRPAGADSDVDTAARVEVLLPTDAPDAYADAQFFAESYMAKLPSDETAAFGQITLRFPKATNTHAPWHQATSWLRTHYVERIGVPVLAILHAPFLAGSDSSVHVHGLVMMRKLSCFGWLGAHRDLAGDAALAAAEASWLEWLAS